ncbi:MAG: hypothetical protein GY821_07900, partial [Gammaproteobacteria bacterium]|nr:hypothetical protein [Gammaproteobacteria bacterium]
MSWRAPGLWKSLKPWRKGLRTQLVINLLAEEEDVSASQSSQSRCILSKMLWHHGNKTRGIDHYLESIRTAYSVQASPPVCKWPDSVSNYLFRETVGWIIEDLAPKLWMDLYRLAMHGTQGKLYRDLKTPIQQLKRFFSRLAPVELENVPLSDVPYSNRNYPSASMFRPIFRIFRYLMCVNHQGEFNLAKYRSKPKYNGMPSDPTFYMSPDEATQFNTLSLKQKEDWDCSGHWEDLRKEKIMTSTWFRDWRAHLGNQDLYRDIRNNWVRHGESHIEFYARMKRVLLKPPEDVEVAASSSQPPGDGGPGSGGVKEVTQLIITKTASGRQVAESTDKKEDPGDQSDKPDQQEPPEQQSESKSAEKPPPTPPPREIVSQSPSVSGQSEQAGHSVPA